MQNNNKNGFLLCVWLSHNLNYINTVVWCWFHFGCFSHITCEVRNMTSVSFREQYNSHAACAYLIVVVWVSFRYSYTICASVCSGLIAAGLMHCNI